MAWARRADAEARRAFTRNVHKGPSRPLRQRRCHQEETENKDAVGRRFNKKVGHGCEDEDSLCKHR